ncbi:LAQU0S03e08262g1_1 [Lachancea quebecensis]|uniref:LAQU0S03e08262g1_1 n=1 Tax=Lachancea quebecensis TaxID=1654605 RepID=A0A0P1KPD0_9SACH|nr:LAQU0S03e08262g1_1 [Lachancea quebecensis]
MAPESPSELSAFKFRKRVPKACDHCRKRKIKCGAVNPITGTCDNCTKFNTVCTFKHHDEIGRHRKYAELKKLQSHEPKARKISESSSPGASATDRKLEQLELQISKLHELTARQQFQSRMCSRHSPSLGVDTIPDMSPAPKQKRYFTSLLTKRRIAWLRNQSKTFNASQETSGDAGSPMLSFYPLTDAFMVASKWYVAQVKKIIDFSNPFVPFNSSQLYPLPPQELANIAVKAIQENLSPGSFNVVRGPELQALFDKHYANQKLTYSEVLLLDIILTVSNSYPMTNDPRCLKEGENEPAAMQGHMLLNAMNQYHKVALLSEGIRSVQALLILYQYVSCNVSGEAAYNIFNTTQRFAQDIGLNRKESYNNLSLEEASLRLKMWYSCILADSQLSLAFCRAPLINLEDTSVFTEEFYMELVKERNLGNTERATIQTLEEAIQNLLGSPDTFLLGAAYYGVTLTRLFHKAYRRLLAANSMTDVTFDQVIEGVLDIKSDLIRWEKSLPPSLALEEYEENLARLRNTSGEPLSSTHFDILSTTVLQLHYEHLYLNLIVSQIACSFVFDNEDILPKSRYNGTALRRTFVNDACDSAVQMMKLWHKIKIVPHMVHRLFYTFSTGAFVLLLTVIAFPDEDRVVEYISIMCTTFEYLLEMGEARIFKDNIKWNVTLFVFCFLLTLSINYFNACNPRAKDSKFSSAPFRNSLEALMNRCTMNKDVAVNQLREHLNLFAPGFDENSEIPENSGATTGTRDACKGLPRALYLFSEVDEEDLRCLMSSLPVQVPYCNSFGPETDTKGSAMQASPNKSSQYGFRSVPSADGDFTAAFSLGLPPSEEPQTLGGGPPSDQVDFENMLDDMLFDRDFTFPTLM